MTHQCDKKLALFGQKSIHCFTIDGLTKFYSSEMTFVFLTFHKSFAVYVRDQQIHVLMYVYMYIHMDM